jgi:rhodanese-related sulfurtransferase
VSDPISVHDLKARRDRGDDLVLLDVREPDELAMASLPGALHVPMGEVLARLAELPKHRDIVVMCHTGRRSERVARILRANGFPQAANLGGGIDAWSCEIDPGVPRY